MTLPNSVDVTGPSGSSYPTVAATYGSPAYKATIDEAITMANLQSAQNVKSGSAGIVYILGVVAVVKPKMPIQPPTIVERFDIPSAQ